MPSFKTIAVVLLASTASALPSSERLTSRQLHYHDLSKRQNEAAAAAGLTDVDILQLYVPFSPDHV